MKTIEDIDKSRVPQHVAIIMDGNGRWAMKQDQIRLFGHQHAMTAVRESVQAASYLNIKYLTLYTFSTENWNRPQDEVDGLMNLIVSALEDEMPMMIENHVKLMTIGEFDRLPEHSRRKLQECMDILKDNKGTKMILALSYSSRWEVAHALKSVVRDAQAGRLSEEQVNEETLRNYLVTKDFPDPDLLIRTGGELRVSNFLLWQLAYTEFWFTDLLWPDFRRGHFYQAVYDYQQRQRRYGKTEAQVEEEA
ncbi:MAG: isoprenyl transferase [Bacteroidales bacterium]|nr:isoprenyl transferase [Bacteroidales bacterium]